MSTIIFGAACLTVLLALLQAAQADTNAPVSAEALSIPPTYYWDGDDGLWSTFAIRAGTPYNNLRVLPATGVTTSWLVLTDACPDTGSPDCESRGWAYHARNSTTFEVAAGNQQNDGVFQLNIWLESQLGFLQCQKDPKANYCAGYYGYDTFTLGWQGSSLPTIKKQLVAGIVLSDFYIGTIGLLPYPENITTFNNPATSLMENLSDQNEIPSISYGYTAGSYNSTPQVFGSLTLGGYDSSRFVPNNLNFTFGPDQSRFLLIGVQSITYTDKNQVGSTSLLSTPDYWAIDSLVPYMWLPEPVYQAFEKAFGLEWNENAELYLVNDSLHQSLLKRNPSVTFTIGPTLDSQSTDIQIPYWALDLLASPPLVENQSRYFPIKRATNRTTYILGRSFLQCAYIIVDYERQNFTLAQALYPDQSVQSNIVSILRPLNQTSSSPSASSSASSSASPSAGSTSGDKGLGTGAIAGIAVAAAGILIIVAVACFIVYRHRRKRKTGSLPSEQGGKPELDSVEPALIGRAEAESGENRHELDVAGKDEDPNKHAEVEGHALHELADEVQPVYEMPGDDPSPAELEGTVIGPKPAVYTPQEKPNIDNPHS